MKKVLLMGKSNSGKTSMRSIIFANYLAKETFRLGPTFNVEHSHVRFLGNLVLNLWDCGGQDRFMENYFESQKDYIFRNVEVLIYVFDIESRSIDKDMNYFLSCLEAIAVNSVNCKIFCLIHKMDLIPTENERKKVFEEKVAEINRAASPIQITYFRTSIWDETLYKAWSSIVYSLVPNIEELESRLYKFSKLCEADEVVIFEKATFLVISHCRINPSIVHDEHRFEKISNIIKQFKLSCMKSQSQFQSMEVHNANFTAFIDIFTSNTYIMVIMSNKNMQPAAIMLNISTARGYFENFISTNSNV